MEILPTYFPQGWYVKAEKKPSPFFNERPSMEISVLVIHNISLPAGQFGTPHVQDLFLGCLDCNGHESFADLRGVEVSAHFFISRQGHLTQFVATDKRAWHAGVSSYQGRYNVNDFSVGIELEGADDIPYTDQQYDTLEKLTRDIMAEYPVTSDAIVGHCDIAPSRKTDPGASFDWKRYRQSIGI
jgi:N-acetyl-anhydromuramoyl-L-alanine amidase